MRKRIRKIWNKLFSLDSKLDDIINELHTIRTVQLAESQENQIAILDLASTLYMYNKASTVSAIKILDAVAPDVQITEAEKDYIESSHCPTSKIAEHHDEDELLHNIETRKRPVRLTDNKKQALIKDAKKLSRPELCEKYDVSERTVRRLLGGKG